MLLHCFPLHGLKDRRKTESIHYGHVPDHAFAICASAVLSAWPRCCTGEETFPSRTFGSIMVQHPWPTLFQSTKECRCHRQILKPNTNLIWSEEKVLSESGLLRLLLLCGNLLCLNRQHNMTYELTKPSRLNGPDFLGKTRITSHHWCASPPPHQRISRRKRVLDWTVRHSPKARRECCQVAKCMAC